MSKPPMSRVSKLWPLSGPLPDFINKYFIGTQSCSFIDLSPVIDFELPWQCQVTCNIDGSLQHQQHLLSGPLQEKVC